MGVTLKVFTLQEFKDKYYEKELKQYEDVVGDMRDDLIAVCRYFHWNKDTISQKWFEDQDKPRL